MENNLLTKKDVTKAWAGYQLAAEPCNNYERLTALGFSYAVSDALEKLYKDNPEEYKLALQRHLLLYNSEAIFGSAIIGITLALEEERAKMMNDGASNEKLIASAEMISNLKIGLMGPLAGIGDTLNHSMISPLILSLFIPLAAQGSWLGGVGALLVWGTYMSGLSYFLTMKGYTVGKKSITQLLQSGRMSKIIQIASILGLFMMGALSSTYVKLVTTVSWTNAAGDVLLLQDYIDAILPKFLPLVAVAGIYLYFKKKGPKFIPAIVTVLGISMVFSFLGIV